MSEITKFQVERAIREVMLEWVKLPDDPNRPTLATSIYEALLAQGFICPKKEEQ